MLEKKTESAILGQEYFMINFFEGDGAFFEEKLFYFCSAESYCLGRISKE